MRVPPPHLQHRPRLLPRPRGSQAGGTPLPALIGTLLVSVLKVPGAPGPLVIRGSRQALPGLRRCPGAGGRHGGRSQGLAQTPSVATALSPTGSPPAGHRLDGPLGQRLTLPGKQQEKHTGDEQMTPPFPDLMPTMPPNFLSSLLELVGSPVSQHLLPTGYTRDPLSHPASNTSAWRSEQLKCQGGDVMVPSPPTAGPGPPQPWRNKRQGFPRLQERLHVRH